MDYISAALTDSAISLENDTPQVKENLSRDSDLTSHPIWLAYDDDDADAARSSNAEITKELRILDTETPKEHITAEQLFAADIHFYVNWVLNVFITPNDSHYMSQALWDTLNYQHRCSYEIALVRVVEKRNKDKRKKKHYLYLHQIS